MSNPPIYVTGSTPIISIQVGLYENAPIPVLLRSITGGQTVTIRDIDGLTQPLTRFIRISTVQGVTFQNGSNIVDLLQPFDTFTTTSYNLTTWLPMARIIQGDNSNQSSYLTAYNSLMSTFTFSTVSTNSDLYVRGSTIFYGNVVGLDPLFSSESMSTQQISTGRAIVGQLNAKDTTDPTILAFTMSNPSTMDRIFTNRWSTHTLYQGTLAVSTIRVLNESDRSTWVALEARDGALYSRANGLLQVYPTQEQTGQAFSNTSTQVAPTILPSQLLTPLSSISTYASQKLAQVRYDPGLSTLSSYVGIVTGGGPAPSDVDYGYSNLSTLFTEQIPPVDSRWGVSSLSTVFSLGISTVVIGPGANAYQIAMQQCLSTLNAQPGISTISSIIGPGLSSIAGGAGLSTISTIIAPAFSSVAALPGVERLSTTYGYGISTVNNEQGYWSLSSLFSYAISTVNTTPGVSSLSSYFGTNVSSFQTAREISSLSSLLSYGMSTLNATPGYSSLVIAVQKGLSSVSNSGYLVVENEAIQKSTNTATWIGTQILQTTFSFGASTVNDAQGVSSVSTVLSQGLSSVYAGPGISSLSTILSLGLSTVVGTINFVPNTSTLSTFLKDSAQLQLQDNQYATPNLVAFTISNAKTYLNNQLYPRQINYINTSTIETQRTQVFQGFSVEGTLVVSTVDISQEVKTTSMSSLTASTMSTFVQSSMQFQDVSQTTPNPTSLFLQNGILQFGNTVLRASLGPGVSSLSTVWGLGYQLWTDGQEVSSLSTQIVEQLSSLRYDTGLSSLSSQISEDFFPNYSNFFSTLNLAVSSLKTTTFITPRFSMGQLSTLFTSTQTVSQNTASLTNVIADSISGITTTINLYTPAVLVSNLSTGALVVSTLTPFQTSSLTLTHAFASTVSSAQTCISTIQVQRSTTTAYDSLNASAGFLYLSGLRVITEPPPTFSNISVGTVALIDGLYGGTVAMNPQYSSLTAALQASLIGTGGHVIQQATSKTLRPGDTWGFLMTGGYQENTKLTSNAMTFGNSFAYRSDNNPYFQTDAWNTFTSTNNGSTFALAWDGTKLLQGGLYIGCNDWGMLNFIPPATYGMCNSVIPSGDITTIPPTVNWFRSTMTFTANPIFKTRDIHYENNLYLATGLSLNGADSLQTSADGITWRTSVGASFTINSTSPNSPDGGYCIAYNGQYYLVGGKSIGSESPFLKSVDGINWTDPTPGTLTGKTVRKLAWNGQVWVAGWQGSGSNLSYSYDGSNWTNATGVPWSATTDLFINNLLWTGTYFLATPATEGNTADFSANPFVYSFNGIQWYSLTGVDGSTSQCKFIVSLAYNGSHVFGTFYTGTTERAFVWPANVLTQTGLNYIGHDMSTILATSLGPGRVILTKDRMEPSLTMEHLEIWGSTIHRVYHSTNTIQGFANTPVDTVTTDNKLSHLAHANHLFLNNTLNILGYTSTLVQIAEPGLSNATVAARNSFMNLPKATLEVSRDVRVSGTATAPSFYARGASDTSRNPPTLANQDQSLTAYIPGAFQTTAFAAGFGATANTFMSTPLTFFDIDCAEQNYPVFRQDAYIGSNAVVTALSNSASSGEPITCIPLADSGTLRYFWRVNGSNYTYAESGTSFFTGQHPVDCKDITWSNLSEYVGRLVSVADQGYSFYDPQGNQHKGKEAIFITGALPIVKLTTEDQDAKVFGVVSDRLNNETELDGSYEAYHSSIYEHDIFGRVVVNALGEGGIWVTNMNGPIANGDYLCSSAIPGYARKQGDTILHNYTVAKATMSCDFNRQTRKYRCEPLIYEGTTYLRAFIGCTYHCA